MLTLIAYARGEISLNFLNRRYPFLAKEVVRQNLGEADLASLFKLAIAARFKKPVSPREDTQIVFDGTKRWSRLTGQNGGLAKVDSGFDYAANFSWFAWVA